MKFPERMYGRPSYKRPEFAGPIEARLLRCVIHAGLEGSTMRHVIVMTVATSVGAHGDFRCRCCALFWYRRKKRVVREVYCAFALTLPVAETY